MKENKHWKKCWKPLQRYLVNQHHVLGFMNLKYRKKLVEKRRKMFRKMSEALTFQLVKNKILNIEAYEIWAYSIEIILLNGSILLGCLLISFMLGE